MIIWFAVTAVLSIVFVFGDPRFDHRLLILGAVAPSVTMLVGGWVLVINSIVAAIGALIVVMVVTAGRRPIRRTLLGLPIGMLLHCVFRGVWSSTDVFWWPFTGGDLSSADAVITGGGVLPALVFEATGIALAAWMWRRAGLGDAETRRRFVATGQLVLS